MGHCLEHVRSGKNGRGRLLPRDPNTRLFLGQYVEERLHEGDYDVLVVQDVLPDKSLEINALGGYIRCLRRSTCLSEDEKVPLRSAIETDLSITAKDAEILLSVAEKCGFVK